MAQATDLVVATMERATGPYSGATADALLAGVERLLAVPPDGLGLQAALQALERDVLPHLITVQDPACVAHLHCPPLLTSLVAEQLIAATNQSLDSWDQSGVATVVEIQVVRWLCELLGLGDQADGVFTSGGTQSNFMGLLLARDHAVQRHFNCSVAIDGLPPEARRLRIICSAETHFSVRQSARLLGLGDQAIVPLMPDAQHALDATEVDQTIERLAAEGLIPFVVVATAGTTDFGAIDPLEDLAACLAPRGVWLHVDAAVGGALAFAENHRHRLSGIQHADSVTVDFHKLLFQSISCGALLVRRDTDFAPLKHHEDYLNPEGNEADGLLDLVGKSIQTTRRFDALKVLLSLAVHGVAGLGELVDALITTTSDIAALMREVAELEVLGNPSINTLVFRYRPVGMSEDAADIVNRQIKLALLRDGTAVIGQTAVAGRTFLKFTLMNPMTSTDMLSEVVRDVCRAGARAASLTQ